MQSIFWSVEEVALRAKQFYENGIRQNVESGDNIGKMIVIDAETGEYGIDSTGVETALKLKQKNPNARLFTIRIGYDVAVSFGGAMERYLGVTDQHKENAIAALNFEPTVSPF